MDIITAIIKRCSFCIWVLRIIAIGAPVRLIIGYNEIPDWVKLPLISVTIIQAVSTLIASILLLKIKKALILNDIVRAKKISNRSWIFIPFGPLITLSMYLALQRYEKINVSNRCISSVTDSAHSE